jgi:hypothetical protein
MERATPLAAGQLLVERPRLEERALRRPGHDAVEQRVDAGQPVKSERCHFDAGDLARPDEGGELWDRGER